MELDYNTKSPVLVTDLFVIKEEKYGMLGYNRL